MKKFWGGEIETPRMLVTETRIKKSLSYQRSYRPMLFREKKLLSYFSNSKFLLFSS